MPSPLLKVSSPVQTSPRAGALVCFARVLELGGAGSRESASPRLYSKLRSREPNKTADSQASHEPFLRNNSNLLWSSGGEPGSPGLSLLLKADGRIINLGGKASVNIKPGVSK